jgi:hypothetical protein
LKEWQFKINQVPWTFRPLITHDLTLAYSRLIKNLQLSNNNYLSDFLSDLLEELKTPVKLGIFGVGNDEKEAALLSRLLRCILCFKMS